MRQIVGGAEPFPDIFSGCECFLKRAEIQIQRGGGREGPGRTSLCLLAGLRQRRMRPLRPRGMQLRIYTEQSLCASSLPRHPFPNHQALWGRDTEDPRGDPREDSHKKYEATYAKRCWHGGRLASECDNTRNAGRVKSHQAADSLIKLPVKLLCGRDFHDASPDISALRWSVRGREILKSCWTFSPWHRKSTAGAITGFVAPSPLLPTSWKPRMERPPSKRRWSFWPENGSGQTRVDLPRCPAPWRGLTSSADASWRRTPAVSIRAKLLRLDIGRADHLAPFLGFVGEKLAVLGRSERKR